MSEVINKLEKKERIKGEFTIVVEGNSLKNYKSGVNVESELLKLKEQGSTLKQAVSDITDKYKLQKNEVYKTALVVWDK